MLTVSIRNRHNSMLTVQLHPDDRNLRTSQCYKEFLNLWSIIQEPTPTQRSSRNNLVEMTWTDVPDMSPLENNWWNRDNVEQFIELLFDYRDARITDRVAENALFDIFVHSDIAISKLSFSRATRAKTLAAKDYRPFGATLVQWSDMLHRELRPQGIFHCPTEFLMEAHRDVLSTASQNNPFLWEAKPIESLYTELYVRYTNQECSPMKRKQPMFAVNPILIKAAAAHSPELSHNEEDQSVLILDGLMFASCFMMTTMFHLFQDGSGIGTDTESVQYLSDQLWNALSMFLIERSGYRKECLASMNEDCIALLRASY